MFDVLVMYDWIPLDFFSLSSVIFHALVALLGYAVDVCIVCSHVWLFLFVLLPEHVC